MIAPFEWPKAKMRCGSIEYWAASWSIRALMKPTSSMFSRAATPQQTPPFHTPPGPPATFTPSGCTTMKPLLSANPSMWFVRAN